MDEFKSMIFYSSWYETANKHGAKFRDKIINQLLRYGLYGELPDNSSDPVMEMMFEMAKPNIDANIQKKINGAKGGRPKKTGKNSDEKTILKPQGLSNADANANANANADAYANGNVDRASASTSLEASRSEPVSDEKYYSAAEMRNKR